MGYLLVISNDDDDDDECELCVYPQLKDVPAAGRPNSIHDLECVTKRRVQRTPSARPKLMQKKPDARYVSIYASRNNEDAVDDNLVPPTRRWRSTRSTVADVMYSSSSGYRRDKTVMIMAPSPCTLFLALLHSPLVYNLRRELPTALTRAIKPVFVPQLCVCARHIKCFFCAFFRARNSYLELTSSKRAGHDVVMLFVFKAPPVT